MFVNGRKKLIVKNNEKDQMKKWQNMSNVNNINASLLSQIAQINVKTVLTLWFSFNQEDKYVTLNQINLC